MFAEFYRLTIFQPALIANLTLSVSYLRFIGINKQGMHFGSA